MYVTFTYFENLLSWLLEVIKHLYNLFYIGR